MPLTLTVSCFSKIQIGFVFLLLDHPGSPRQTAIRRVLLLSDGKKWLKTDRYLVELQAYRSQFTSL